MKKLFIYIIALALYPMGAMGQDNLSKQLMGAIRHAEQSHNWTKAQSLANRINTTGAQVLLRWSRLRAQDGQWHDYQRFLRDHHDWPGLKRLRRAGETRIPDSAKPNGVLAYFATQTPQTGTGALRLAAAYLALGDSENAQHTIVTAWQTLTLNKDEQNEILTRFKKWVDAHHWARTDHLLWQGQAQQAKRMLNKLSAAQRKLAQTRIALRQGQNGVDQMIRTIAPNLRDDAGLAYDRFRWRIKRGRWDSAQELLLAQTRAANLGRPQIWADRRRGFTRRAMRAGQYNTAYILAANHGLSAGGSNYADLEWLAGFIALQYRNDASTALVHFTRFQNAVNGPISSGRAWYWIGRTRAALGDDAGAQRAYAQAGKYDTSFYGQLGAQKAGLAANRGLTHKRPQPPLSRATFKNSTVLSAAKLLHNAQESPMLSWFLAHMAETMDARELLQLGTFAINMGEYLSVLHIAKEGAKRDIVLPSLYYPLTSLARFNGAVPAEITMSITRQESEFYSRARSSADARGLMQILPGTAREMARKQGVSYSTSRLSDDWRYNARLATAYLAQLRTRYNGSLILTFAAYNAGPGRVNQWLDEIGDPRHASVDPIVWIENIPYRETRNYVMRVMEGLHVYRARISGKARKVNIMADLTRGRQ